MGAITNFCQAAELTDRMVFSIFGREGIELRELHLTYQRKSNLFEFSRRECPTYLKGEEFKLRSFADVFKQAGKYTDLVPVLNTNFCTDEELRPALHLAWCETFGIDPKSIEPLISIEDSKTLRENEIKKMLMDLLVTAGDSVTAWNARNSGEKIDSQLNFTRMDFTGKILNGIDMKRLDWSGGKFDNCEMIGADLSEGHCSKSSFRNSNMKGVRFSYTTATRADFTGADLQELWSFKGSFKNAIFANTNLSKAQFKDCDLRGADLTGSTVDGVIVTDTRYDEKTKLPADFPLEGLVWKGTGVDPRALTELKIALTESAKTFDEFMEQIHKNIETERIKKALLMLKKERFQLFSKILPDQLIGVVQSQSSDELVYSCLLTSEGKFSCCTQNLKPCGGLRGALCKHLLVLLIGLTKSEELSPEQASSWVISSKFHQPKIDKDLMTATFIEYKGALTGEVDWRPTETIPEDYYV